MNTAKIYKQALRQKIENIQNRIAIHDEAVERGNLSPSTALKFMLRDYNQIQKLELSK